MTVPVWTQTYEVNTIVLDDRKRLGFVGLLNLLQDAAWIHARALGWGYEDLIRRGTIWVLARQKVLMDGRPLWGDTVTIRTWGRPASGAIAVREYEIAAGGRKLGECTTSWLILDAATRRPHKFDHAAFNQVCRTDGLLAIEARKITPRDDLKAVDSIRVRNSDLDVNGHVNNTRYAQWILDSMAPEELAALEIADYEVNFLAETRVGDTIVIERGEADGALQFQGRREADAKPAFAAAICAA
ncbi:MAG: acyl-[acyl-carrier-protein] thioesterase [Alphaproteobacteria bacterium]|nr:acyl-[acyl-carrier-protein] thioesterase [Alphaproteobacteria bacterium]